MSRQKGGLHLFSWRTVCAVALWGAASAWAQSGDWASYATSLPTPTGNTYTITTEGQLAALAAAVNGGDSFSGKTVVLANDLNLTAHYWTPVGTNDVRRFTGTFDGRGNTIHGVAIATTNTLQYAGLFGYVGAGGKVQNAALAGTRIFVYRTNVGTIYVGSAAGGNAGMIENCISSGAVSASTYASISSACVGGVTGVNRSGGTVSSCMNSGGVSISDTSPSSDPSGFSTFAGGVVGYNYGGAIVNCTNSGTVSDTDSLACAGGMTGVLMSGTIANCVNSGAVNASSVYLARSGGVAGSSWHGTKIENCSNSGSISGSASQAYASSTAVSAVSGIAGVTIATTIENCLNIGSVAASDPAFYIGGVVGYRYEHESPGVVSDCYWQKDTAANAFGYGSGKNVVPFDGAPGSVNGGTDNLLTALNAWVSGKNVAGGTYSEWRVDGVTDGGYPFLTHAANVAEDNWASYATSLPAPTGNTYTITTEGELAAFAAAVNGGNNFSGKTIVLANDLSLSAHYWTPVGTNKTYSLGLLIGEFTGTFDGQGNAIRGMTIASTDTLQHAGLFGSVGAGGKIQNVTLVDTSIVVHRTSGYVCAGGVAGWNIGGVVSNCRNGGSISASVTGSDVSVYVGGVVGHNSGTVSNCANSGSVSGASSSFSVHAGGVVGVNNGTVSNCTNSGAVSTSNAGATSDAGGVVGYNNNGCIVSDCTNSGNVTALR